MNHDFRCPISPVLYIRPFRRPYHVVPYAHCSRTHAAAFRLRRPLAQVYREASQEQATEETPAYFEKVFLFDRKADMVTPLCMQMVRVAARPRLPSSQSRSGSHPHSLLPTL